jgi:hypothetical protein
MGQKYFFFCYIKFCSSHFDLSFSKQKHQHPLQNTKNYFYFNARITSKHFLKQQKHCKLEMFPTKKKKKKKNREEEAFHLHHLVSVYLWMMITIRLYGFDDHLLVILWNYDCGLQIVYRKPKLES